MAEIASAAALATVVVDVTIHPLDTLITRIQSPYAHHRNRALFAGLYQGFGPTLLAEIPASAAFFTIYESTKAALGPTSIPQPAVHAAASAAGDVVACAIACPAEVIKQHAQVKGSVSNVARELVRRPSTLWRGYTLLLGGTLPGTCVTFMIYEGLKDALATKSNNNNDGKGGGGEGLSVMQEMKRSGMCAAVAAGCSSCLFVPFDVVKTRMRLGEGTLGAFDTAKGIVKKDGVKGLFRGLGLTCAASAVGAGVYLAVYEGYKTYMKQTEEEDEL